MNMNNLDEKKCLHIITSMILDSREHFCEKDGYIFSVWGWTILFVSLVIELLCLLASESVLFFLLWFIVPLISNIVLFMIPQKEYKQKNGAYTQISRSIKYMWFVIGGLLVGIPLFFIGISLIEGHIANLMKFLPFVEILLCSLGVVLSGIIVLYKPCIVGGIVGIILSFSLLFKFSLFVYPLIIAVWSIFSFIIPGFRRKMFSHV